MSEAMRELTRLSQLADGVRAQLLELQHELAEAHRDLEGDNTARLREANAQLVQAALLAQAEAASALESLEALSRAGGALPADQRDMREANAQLLVAALQARSDEADARQDHRRQVHYMAMVAHELRNPLTPIRVAASLLSNRGPDEAPSLARLQAIIERQVTHMTRLVEDLVEGSRVSVGKLRLECATVDIVELLDLAVQTCRPRMQERDQTMILDFGTEAMPAYGDPVRLVQVFCNLLDNASKYTPMGGTITLSASSSDDMLTITFKDNGVGIPPLALESIFDLFVQDDQALELDSRGLGIGLAVVRDLVQSHGGSVVARSDGKDSGSEFVVTLPTAPQIGAH